MSWEDELLALARSREADYESDLARLILDDPAKLRRQLRSYLGEQADRGRIKRTYDDVPRLRARAEQLQELVCEEVEFRSDSTLSFNVLMEPKHAGWLVKRFEFDLHLTGRSVGMIRIHLNQKASHEPLKVPRCHFHIGDSDAHIPFPIMSPRLMLHLICEHIEADVGK